jgi:hypothetical protein
VHANLAEDPFPRAPRLLYFLDSRRPWRPNKGDLVDLSKLTLSDKILGATGILLVIDLLFLPWHHISIDLGPFSASKSYSALSGTGQFWGFLALLLALAVVVVLGLIKFSSVKLPDLPIPLNQAIFYASIATLALLLIKLVTKTDYLGFGAYLGILLAAGMVYGGFLKSKEPAETSGLA